MCSHHKKFHCKRRNATQRPSQSHRVTVTVTVRVGGLSVCRCEWFLVWVLLWFLGGCGGFWNELARAVQQSRRHLLVMLEMGNGTQNKVAEEEPEAVNNNNTEQATNNRQQDQAKGFAFACITCTSYSTSYSTSFSTLFSGVRISYP